jgi:para-nitrobenzyl esterase
MNQFDGIVTPGLSVFRGVPYAAAPVGDLRFAPPQPPPPLSGRHDATRHGPIAPQLPSRLRAAMGDFDRPQSEDCLTLTISTPAADDARRPVLVWLHGGAWISGAGSLEWYDGARLAREGNMVVVGVNYRLGALGYLHLPGVLPEDLGTLDQIAALRWIQDNIAAFGGDPARVTVSGQSAGATTIGRMLTRDDTKGLFHQAILQSGAFGRFSLTPESAGRRTKLLLEALDIPVGGDTLARLRAVPVEQMLAAQGAVMRANPRFGSFTPPFMPVLPEGKSQVQHVAEVATAAAAMPILIGATREECHAFFGANPADPSEADVAAFFAKSDPRPQAMDIYRARRPGATLFDLVADLANDHTFLRPAMDAAQAMARQGGRVFAYQFNWSPPGSRLRACHCIEIPFVFGTMASMTTAPMLAGGDPAVMEALSAVVRRAWTNFVHHGDPADTLTPWPAMTEQCPVVLGLGDIVAPAALVS